MLHQGGLNPRSKVGAIYITRKNENKSEKMAVSCSARLAASPGYTSDAE